jgi:hypothetical protein
VDKCIACHFYDRQNGSQTDSRGIQWGQCRRTSPMLHPINQKTFMIEGVWPHVRDDDWCGEWKAMAVRRVESRPATTDSKAPGPLLPTGTAASLGPRSASVSPFSSSASASATPASALGSLMSSGRGD